MRRLTLILTLAAALAALNPAAAAAADRPPRVLFDRFFVDKALRLDLYQTGDAQGETVTLDRVSEEPVWPGSLTGLIEPFEYGRYAVKLYDIASNTLIFSRGLDTPFAEYKTTTPALDGVKRVFERSVRVPSPKRPALFVFEARDKRHLLRPLFTETIDPAGDGIIRESVSNGGEVYQALDNGDPHTHVDLAFLAEGYTAADREKFRADVDRFSAYLFMVEPYKSAKERFNITGIFHPSPASGVDEPRRRVFRKTALDASFNAFDLERYLLVMRDHRMHEMAARVPYDAIVVLVNSPRYGGGSIAFDYCVTTVDNPRSLQVFVHELGHSFAGLADEYYASTVSYNDFYPKGVEPLEPNITALLDPSDIKWKDLLSPGVAIPTEYGKDELDALEAERRANAEARLKAVREAGAAGATEGELRRIEKKYDEIDKALAAKIAAVHERYAGLEDKVGAFEGAGYASKGLYRPQMYCVMISSPTGEFCRVCRRAILAMIDFFSEGPEG